MDNHLVQPDEEHSISISAVENSIVVEDHGHDDDYVTAEMAIINSHAGVSIEDLAEQTLDDLEEEPVDEVRVVYGWAAKAKRVKSQKSAAEPSTGPLQRWLTQNASSINGIISAADQIKRNQTRKSTLAQSIIRRRERIANRSKSLRVMASIVSSSVFQVFMGILTFWALFGTDLLQATADKDADVPQAWVTLFIMLCFLVELVMLSVVQHEEFFNGFYFWMDVLALVSLIPDTLPLFGVSAGPLASLTLARAGRAARAAARTARFARVIKVFEVCEKRKMKKDQSRISDWFDKEPDSDDEDDAPLRMIDVITDDLKEPSLVAEVVETGLFKRVFFTMLITFLAVAVLTPSLENEALHAEAAMRQVSTMNGVSPAAKSASEAEFVAYYGEDLITAVIHGNVLAHDIDREDKLREQEKLVVEFACPGGCYASFDVRDEARFGSVLSILLTIFLVVFLMLTSGWAYADVKLILITPLERMVAIVKAIALNPLVEIPVREDFSYETGMLESTIAKLGRLLQVGFGAAGTSIISRNLSSSGQLVPLVKGKRVEAIFVHCKIKHFAAINEELKEQITLLVNRACQIIHAECANMSGFPYNNTGDSVDLVWLLPSLAQYDHDEKAHSLVCTAIADNALKAVREIRHKLQKNRYINLLLQQVPTCAQTHLEVGLHKGWAVAGAIGSQLKVNTTYLSHHVRQSHIIQQVTSRYQVNVLFSDEVHDLISDDMRQGVLKLDRAILERGSQQVVSLYTIDNPFDPYNTKADSQNSDSDSEEEEKDEDEELDGWQADIEQQEFKDTFNQGIEAYIEGNWELAHERLQDAGNLIPDNKPQRVVRGIVHFMQANNFKAPEGWKGYRTLYNTGSK